jgi:hypothetical protein
MLDQILDWVSQTAQNVGTRVKEATFVRPFNLAGVAFPLHIHRQAMLVLCWAISMLIPSNAVIYFWKIYFLSPRIHLYSYTQVEAVNGG